MALTNDELEARIGAVEAKVEAKVDKLSADNLAVVKALLDHVAELNKEVEALKKRNHAPPAPPRQPKAAADPWEQLKKGLGIS